MKARAADSFVTTLIRKKTKKRITLDGDKKSSFGISATGGLASPVC